MSRPLDPLNKGTVQSGASAAQGMELRRQLLQCMAETLSRRQYQVFVLNFLEGMSQQEIAAELNISRTSVSRAGMQARFKLRRALGYEFEDDDYLSQEQNIFPCVPYPVQLPGITHVGRNA